MSELKFSLEEELPSPDLFSDPEVETNVSIAGTTEDGEFLYTLVCVIFNIVYAWFSL